MEFMEMHAKGVFMQWWFNLIHDIWRLGSLEKM